MRALMAFLLGSLLIGMILVGVVAGQNFAMVDRLLGSPTPAEFQQKIAPLADGDARVVLRYLSSELNRFYFRVWAGAEILLGGLLLLLAARSGPQGSNDRKFTTGAGVMLALTLLMTFYLLPQIVDLGRAIDFVPRVPPPPELRRFGMLHGVYLALDLAKLLIGIWLTIRLVRQPASGPRA